VPAERPGARVVEFGEYFVQAVLVADLGLTAGQRVFQPGSVERAHAVECSRTRNQPAGLTFGVQQHQAFGLHHLGEGRRAERLGHRFDGEAARQGILQFVEGQAVVDAVDGLDRQLVVHQLVDEGQGQFGGGVLALGRLANHVAVDPGDAIAVVAVGDQHVVGADDLPDGRDAVGVGHSFGAMDDSVDLDLADRLAGLGQCCRQAGRQ